MENNKEVKHTCELEDQINTAVSFIREKTDKVCDVLIVLGSGLGPLADLVENAVHIPYGNIPGFAASSVHGHKGQFVIGDLQGVSVIVMQGRVHFYEGLPVRQITLPIRVAKVLGASVMIITNAAGGLNPNFEVGDLMLITDHINFLGMAGQNPLIGSNNDNLGPRFPQMTDAYTPSLQKLSRTVSEKTGIALRSGVLFSQSGPAYETPAEVKFLRIVGADAVGMSVANEVLVARHSGMEVVGFSSITNVARLSLDEGEPPSHQEVIDAANVVGPKLVTLIRGVLEALPLKK
jgi:purine-nucleoside phosphorylase